MSRFWHNSGFVLAIAVAAACLVLPVQGQRDRGQDADGPGGMPGGKGVMGTVVAVQPDGFTVKTQDGEQWKVTAGANTRVMHEHDPASLSDLKPGYGVGAFGQADATAPNTLHAVFASYQTQAEVKARFADFGKTWIGGKVTSIDGTKITVTVQQPGASSAGTATMVVDETTNFKMGREDVTLADVKPGYYVMGKGGLKNGEFVPTELTIRPQGGHRGAGGRPGGPPPSGTDAGPKY